MSTPSLFDRNKTRRQARQPGPSTTAVALKDGAGSVPGLPRVIAKGRGALAEEIVQRAFAAGIKVREDADLAEILAAVELESEIPPVALAAVEEILLYLYDLNRPQDLPSNTPEQHP